MQAIHSTWSKPRIYSSGGFYIEDFDILTTILSALKWREKNGKIKMATDSVGLHFYASRGMTGIWDEITNELDEIPSAIDPEVFWAAGKIYSIPEVPAAVIDTDFILWDSIAFDVLGALTVIHREELSQPIYPDINVFHMKPGYIFDPDLDWRERPINAAFYVIKDETLRRGFISAAKEFMENAAGDDRLIYMVFAEQRLMAMTAKRLGIAVDEFSTMERLFRNGDRSFTHIWGMKQQMRENAGMRRAFCERCIARILADFPEYGKMLRAIPELEDFFYFIGNCFPIK